MHWNLLAHAGHDHGAPDALAIHLALAMTYLLIAVGIVWVTCQMTRSKPVRIAVSASLAIFGIVAVSLV